MSRRRSRRCLRPRLLGGLAWLCSGLTTFVACRPGNLDAVPGLPTVQDLQRQYAELRFGMLIHFGTVTYTGQWSAPNPPLSEFNPTGLDANQWADAAVAAHMTYAILSVRHIDGFALWPTQASNVSVAHTPWRGGKGDVVQEFVDAFRSRGLKVGFLYSIWDSTHPVDKQPTQAQIGYLTQQLKELLTNYGDISFILFAGWAWEMGHNQVPYQQIREFVKGIQPGCMIFDQTHLKALWEVDATLYDESLNETVPPNLPPVASSQMQKINTSGGTDWFWAPNIGNLMSVTDIVEGHLRRLESHWANFLLNCPPNPNGLLDDDIVGLLHQVGARWKPNLGRGPLPPLADPPIDHPYTPIDATASNGTPIYAIDGVDNYTDYTVWEAGPLPQSITLDLGDVQPDVGLLNYVPRYVVGQGPSSDGAITSYLIETSTDGHTFVPATNGTGIWAPDATMKTAVFGPVDARYLRFSALDANGPGPNAAVTEITVGRAPDGR